MKREILRMAVRGLSANTLRSSLTVLGISIGIAAVIILIAVGNGSANAVRSNITSLGTNLLSISSSPSVASSGTASTSVSLTMSDVRALSDRQLNPNVTNIAPVVNVSDPTLATGTSSYSEASMVGTTPAYLPSHDYTIAEGASFTSQQVSSRARVVVIGPTVAEELYASKNPIGEQLLINGSAFRVVGLTTSKGDSGTSDEDDVVFAPVTAVEDTLSGYGSLDSITFSTSARPRLILDSRSLRKTHFFPLSPRPAVFSPPCSPKSRLSLCSSAG
jgi:putative ABC transport system permease protein